MAMTSQSYFNRGSEYYSESRSNIKSYDMISSDLMVISAMTKGTNNYVQSISVMRDENAKVKLKGRCSCPVGRDCKHVVSASLSFMVEHNFLAQKRAPRKDPLELWLDGLEEIIDTQKERKSILIYRLSPTPYEGKSSWFSTVHGFLKKVATANRAASSTIN